MRDHLIRIEGRDGSVWTLPLAAIVSAEARRRCCTQDEYEGKLEVCWAIIESSVGALRQRIIASWIQDTRLSSIAGSFKRVAPPKPAGIRHYENWSNWEICSRETVHLAPGERRTA